jgi:Transposase DDE domain
VVAPLNTHDLARVCEVHPALQPGDVLVADRGLCAYAHLALLVQAGLHALLRVQARQIVDFTPFRPFVMPGTRRTPAIKGVPRSRWIKAHGQHDQQVEWFKPKTCPPWLAPETFKTLPPTLIVREIRYHVSAPGFRRQPITVVTTLVDSERYPGADVAALYNQRWETEIYQSCNLRRTLFWQKIDSWTLKTARRAICGGEAWRPTPLSWPPMRGQTTCLTEIPT